MRICDGLRLMFNNKDRGAFIRLEMKIDQALVRLGVVEGKQASHEAICDVRERQFEEYVRRKEMEQSRSEEEWDKFKNESRDHSNRIESGIWASHNSLLLKVIWAMFILLVATSGAVVGLNHYGVIK